MKNDIYEAASCTDVETAMLKLTAAAFSGRPIEKEEFSATDWKSVYKEFDDQAAVALPIDVLPQVEEYIDPEMFEDWLSYAVQIMTLGESILYAQDELTQLMSENNIPIGILKGTAASYNYPNPMYRNMGDIDFLVNDEDFDRAYKLMTDNGYELEYDEDHTDYHLTLKKGEITYEIHHEPAGISKGTKGDELRELFKGSCSKAEKTELNGYEFYVLPRLQNGLVLLLHIVKHLDEGLGLRQICDWLAFVDKKLSDEVWEKEFKPVTDSVGLTSLALITTKLCKMYLGLSEKITWCDEADAESCAQLMRFVLDNGNFGKKDKSSNRSLAILGKAGSEQSGAFIVRMFRSLQHDGAEQWDIVKRIPALKCIAWTYIPIRYIGKIIKGERSLSYTKHLAQTVNKNKSLQDKLAVYK